VTFCVAKQARQAALSERANAPEWIACLKRLRQKIHRDVFMQVSVCTSVKRRITLFNTGLVPEDENKNRGLCV
jgi:hypothetical protein